MNNRIVSKEIFEQALSKTFPHLLNSVSISIDSRSLKPFDVFFAIRGEFNDGHNYIDEACQKGASLIVAEENAVSSIPDKTPSVLVKNSLDAFSEIARRHLISLSAIRIGVTGSNGKTTTKEMIKAALSKVVGPDLVYASSGNMNNHFGVPLTALEANASHRFLIFEMGMNHQHEIARLCSIVNPNIGVITNISFAHEGNFPDGIDGVAMAKGELFDHLLKNNGHAIVNIDDERVEKLAQQFAKTKQTSFGHKENADVKIVSCKPFSMESLAQSVTLIVDNDAQFSVDIPLLGSHHASNAACALAVVKSLSLSVPHASSGLMDMTKTKGRTNLTKSPRGYLLINDGYNANPASMTAGILASLEIPSKRRIAAIGAMGELGERSAHYHRELGKLLAMHFDQVFICGDDGRYALESAQDEGMHEQQIVFKNTSQELIEPLKHTLQEGDLLFVKGSLSANMDVIVTALS